MSKKTHRRPLIRRRKNCGFRDICSRSELHKINEIVQATRVAKNKRPWRVVPKDSCEVYKNRRKRQLESEHKREEKNRKDSNSRHKIVKPNKDTKKIDSKRVSKKKPRRRKRNIRWREDDSSINSASASSWSTMSASSCCSCMDYD